MARPKGVGGRPGAGHGPPTSRCTGVRGPCRPPQRSLPSCPSEVPAPPGTRGKLRPDAGRLLDSRWGAGPGQPGRGCAAGSEEARRQTRSRSSCNPEPRLQGSTPPPGSGEESKRGWRKEETGGGSGRRKEGGAGGGGTQVGWKVRLAGGRAGRSLPAPLASALAPLPFSSQPPLCGRSERPGVWDLPDRCTQSLPASESFPMSHLFARHPQLSLATRGEDWASQGQPKGKAEIPVVTRECRRNS